MRIGRFLLVLVVSTASLVALPATAVETTPTVALLDVSIRTSSDWTAVKVWPGTVMGQTLVSVPRDVTLRRVAQGWTIRSTPGVNRTVRLKVVFEDRSLASPIRVAVAKGRKGVASVTVRNTSNAGFTAAYVVNRLTRTGTRVVTVSRTRSQFFGAAGPPLRRADAERHVLAFYYPWFDAASYNDPKLSDRPIDRRGTIGPQDVLFQTQTARNAGIDGFIVSWAGESNHWAAHNGIAFDNVLNAARHVGGVGTVLIETVMANGAPDDPTKPSDPATVNLWIRQALTRADHPSFLRSGGVPVIFVYQMARLAPSVWRSILDGLAADGIAVRLVGDAPPWFYGSVEWGVYRYDVPHPYELAVWSRQNMYYQRLLAPVDATGPRLFAATVSPGYDDRNARGADRPVVARGTNGERYSATWAAGMTASPDWVLVTSWNEWFEGTAVQPSENFGDLALRQTADQASRFRAGG